MDGDGIQYGGSSNLLVATGEICNFVAYAFSPAILVAPLMAVSVVVRLKPVLTLAQSCLSFYSKRSLISLLPLVLSFVCWGP